MGKRCLWGLEQFRTYLDAVLWVGQELGSERRQDREISLAAFEAPSKRGIQYVVGCRGTTSQIFYGTNQDVRKAELHCEEETFV